MKKLIFFFSKGFYIAPQGLYNNHYNNNFNMSAFKRFEEGMDSVNDYAIFIDIEDYQGDKSYIFHSLYNECEYPMTITEENEDHHDMINEAVTNAYKGVITFAKIVVTQDDNWIDQLYTVDDIKQLITFAEYTYLFDAFKKRMGVLIKNKMKYDLLSRELDDMREMDPLHVVETIGSFTIEKRVHSNSERQVYIERMEKECERYIVHFPLLPFMTMNITV
jgi:hypothetical protein